MRALMRSKGDFEMNQYKEQARMTFEQFEAFCQLNGFRSRKGKEHIGDSVISFMYATGPHNEYKCDNVRLWSRSRHVAT